jgi:lipopolysaccharide/colanic/teichoic acid biosynthesis glycosyltransferase
MNTATSRSHHGSAPPAPRGRLPVVVPESIDASELPTLVSSQTLARAVKRLFDITLSGLGLLVLAPLLAVLAAIVRLDSEGPAFYSQPRVGRGDRPFTISKLRTMDGSGEVTRVGRLLRPTGIDELPQLWQVFKGDMSIVGPRPEEPHRAARWERELPDYRARHLVRPGITGWAQVNGLRGKVSIAERLRYDLQYLKSWTLMLDWRILFWTVAAVWRDTRRELGS